MSAPKTTKLNVSTLENREMLSVSSITFNAGIVTVNSDNTATTVRVDSDSATGGIKITSGSTVRSFTGVTEVDFIGGARNDSFTNNVTTLKTKAWGNAGNDYLEGYNGADQFVGGDGNDTLVGYGGNDMLWGGNGDDTIKGMDGDDQLMGDAGNDTLNGGAGSDKFWGGVGDDILIAIDNGSTDTVQGDAGRDGIWVDGGSFSDTVNAGDTGDKVKRVASFANGADRTLNGDNIADPGLASGNTYKRFSGPLFSASGPQFTDIRQGNIGDCWLLSGLGAIALDNPTAIRQNVVDFGDGTFGVHLGSNFYRVDADLPTTNNSTPSAAGLGAGGSLWVAIAEKAFAQFRTANGTSNSYNAIDGGWSVEVNKAFGATSTNDQAISSFANGTALGNAMYSAWNSYSAVTIGFLTVPGGAPLVAMHMYQVVSFTRDASGNVTAVTLRNPWGVDGAGSDSNPNDGLVTVSVGTLFACTGRVNWGRV